MNTQTAPLSTPLREHPAEARVVLKGVSWQTFKALMADIGEDRSCRLAYDQGMLEIRVPYEQHEEPKILIAGWEQSLQFSLTWNHNHNSTYRVMRFSYCWSSRRSSKTSK
jgi:hypothetical protein